MNRDLDFEAKCMKAHEDGDSTPLQDHIDALGQAIATERHTAESKRVLTCVFCGKEYAKGTPTSQHEDLYKHIATCLKHPLAKAILLLKNARPFLRFAPRENRAQAEKLFEQITVFFDTAGVSTTLSDDERLK